MIIVVQKLNLRLLNEMANQFSENQSDIKTLLKVYWPKSKCRLLENDLEILDSPGVDYKDEHDDCITRYCEDADVFILVVDGSRSLEKSVRNLFIGIFRKYFHDRIKHLSSESQRKYPNQIYSSLLINGIWLNKMTMWNWFDFDFMIDFY